MQYYAVVKAIPLPLLLGRNDKDKTDWTNGGFTIDGLRNAVQGYDENGLHTSVLPISDIDQFNEKYPTFQQICVDSAKVSDSIEKVSESQVVSIIAGLVSTPPVEE